MDRIRTPRLFVVVPLAATALVAAYVWRLERRVATLGEDGSTLAARAARGSDLERIEQRLAALELTLAETEARLATLESAPPSAGAESSNEVPSADSTLEDAPRGWRDELREIWNAIARLEDRALDDSNLFLAGDEIDPVQLLEAGLDLVEESASPRGKGFSADRLLGEPDTPECGDTATAWASLSQDAKEEWIEVDFSRATLPHAVIIRETYNPGAVVRIEGDANGRWASLWEGDDATNVCPGNLVVGVGSRAFVLSTLRVVLDCSRVSGWNEIDAIGVLSDDGIQWAAAARVSSSYADQ